MAREQVVKMVILLGSHTYEEGVRMKGLRDPGEILPINNTSFCWYLFACLQPCSFVEKCLSLHFNYKSLTTSLYNLLGVWNPFRLFRLGENFCSLTLYFHKNSKGKTKRRFTRLNWNKLCWKLASSQRRLGRNRQVCKKWHFHGRTSISPRSESLWFSRENLSRAQPRLIVAESNITLWWQRTRRSFSFCSLRYLS